MNLRSSDVISPTHISQVVLFYPNALSSILSPAIFPFPAQSTLGAAHIDSDAQHFRL